MKGLRKIITIVLAMCLIFSLFSVSACKEEKKDEYYAYDSADIQADLSFSEQYEYKEEAEIREQFLTLEVQEIAQANDLLYAQNLAKLSENKFVWYMEDGFEEYTISSWNTNKIIISEIDAQTYSDFNLTLNGLGATIQEMALYLTKQNGTLKLCVEISATQNLFAGENLSASYTFEYSFVKTETRPETEGDKNPSAVYRYQDLALDISVTESGSTTLPLDLKEQLVSGAKTTMDGVLATYNTGYLSAKLSIFNDKVIWHYSGVKTTYNFEEKEGDKELLELDKGFAKTLKDLISLYGKIGANFSFGEIKCNYVTSGNNCQLKLEIEGTATAFNGQVAVPIEVVYKYTINFRK